MVIPDRLTTIPSVAAYLSLLPEGLDSYPESRFAAGPLFSATERLRDDHADVYGDIMGEFAEARLGWVPDVRAVCTSLATRELLFSSDLGFHQWMANHARSVFSNGVYRSLFWLLSPSLVLMGAKYRWGALRQGSTLRTIDQSTNGDTRTTVLELTMPENLFPKFIVESFARRFEIAVELSRANDPRATVTEYAPDSARFELVWR